MHCFALIVTRLHVRICTRDVVLLNIAACAKYSTRGDEQDVKKVQAGLQLEQK